MSVSAQKCILVTGSAGFIGSSLVETLLRKKYQVIGIDNFNDYYSPDVKERNVKPFLSHSSFKLNRIDILDQKELEGVFEDNKIEAVVHLAARAGVRPSLKNPVLYKRVNVTGTSNLLELAKKFRVKQFVFASSSSVYGNQEKIPFSENDQLARAVSPYAETKIEAEKLCYQFSKEEKIKTTVLRFFTVFGPKGRPDMAPYIFCKHALINKPIVKFGDGSSSRDYTYIDDVVKGIVKAIEKPFEFEIINLGNNKPVCLNEFIMLVEKITKKKLEIVNKPRHKADVKRTFADISKAKKLLNWQPEIDLETGMKLFIDWLKKQNLE